MPAKPKRGPARQYATAACRKRAERRRRVAYSFVPDLTPMSSMPAEPIVMPSRPADEQVHRAIVEARAIGFAFLRLGGQARPELAWRCTKAGDAIVAAIAEHFGKELI